VGEVLGESNDEDRKFTDAASEYSCCLQCRSPRVASTRRAAIRKPPVEDEVAKLTFFGMMISLDGFINDAKGDFNWGQIDKTVHEHANAETRQIGTMILGRRMYETMVAWETYSGDTEFEAEFAKIWRGLDKLVVSKTLKQVKSKRTNIVPQIDLDEMRRLKASAPRDLAVAGPTLASTYLAAGLIDEIGICYVPVIVGVGTPMFQQVHQTLTLERIQELAFANGVVFVRYRVRN
jgi:dihydrofolate reductase